jgi:spore coat polysaccharide biosynthesis predicted glycosyltransferase SpsG
MIDECEILVVCDAGPHIGLGHASRCSALASELTARGLVVEVQSADPAMAQKVVSLPVGAYEHRKAGVIVMDGYRYSDQDRLARKLRARHLVLIDDLADTPFPADLIVNQNLHARGLDYAEYEARQLLLGPEFALLRSEYAALHESPRPEEGAVLVTLGGSTIGQQAVGIANRLADRIDRTIYAVVGSEVSVPSHRHARVEVLSGIDMQALMAECRHYVGAMGVSYLEALAAGLSTTAIAIPASQRPAVKAARDQGLVVLDRIEDPNLVDTVVEALECPWAPLSYPDGLGVKRVADAIVSLL